MQHGLLATDPSLILTIFEATDVNRFAHAYTGENFQISAQGFFHVPKTPDFGTVDTRQYDVGDRPGGQRAHFPAIGFI